MDTPAELELELKNYCKEIDSELKDKAEKGELEIEWDPFRTYKGFEPRTFTTDIPKCVLDKKALEYKNFCPENGCVVYGTSGKNPAFVFASMYDILVRGSEYERTVYTPNVTVGNLPKQTCLLLDENTLAFIESNQPGWKPSSTFTFDECFNLSVNFSVNGFCTLLKS